MGVKAPCLGFLVVPGTFQALGHLFLGPKNTVPGRGNKKIWKPYTGPAAELLTWSKIRYVIAEKVVPDHGMLNPYH